MIDSQNVKHTVNGIKGPSWLSFCPKFDMVNGVAIDYMHGVLLSVQKLFLRLWFTKEFSPRSFNYFTKINEVDNRMMNIHQTLDISRLPRSIENDLKYWNAIKFQNFLVLQRPCSV